METVVAIADHAARQSDRWLFLATLVCFLLAMLGLAKWFIADRSKLAERLTTMTDRHIAQSEKLSEVVTNNTTALNSIGQKIEKMELNCRYGRGDKST